MLITETAVPDVFRIDPEPLLDHRGVFYEAVRRGPLEAAVGHSVEVRQVHCTVSGRHVLRGLHATTLPPGQAKILTCVRGSVLTMVVDMRVGSPSFGRYEAVRQDARSGTALYLPDGIGLGYVALADDTCMNYLCTEEYVPGMVIDVDALDPELDLPWGLTEAPVRSARDAAAPSLRAAASAGILPTYEDCLRVRNSVPPTSHRP